MVHEEGATVETVASLLALTGRESGIVIFYGDGSMRPEGIVCNWSTVNGLPRLFAGGLIGLGETFAPDEGDLVGAQEILALLEGVNVVYSGGEDMPASGRLYRLPEHRAAVLAPEGWA